MHLNRNLEFKIEKALEGIKIIYEFKEKELFKKVFVNSGVLFYKNFKAKLYETIISGNSIFVSTSYNPLGALWILNYYRVLGEPSLLYTSKNDLNAEWIDAPKEIIFQRLMLLNRIKRIKIKQLVKLAQAIL